MVDRTVEHFGHLDVLINNAGASRMSRADALDPDSVRHLLEVNFIAAVTATNRALVSMRRQHGGLIINVGSPGALLGVPFFASYAASKAAMHGWTTTLQSEWAGSEIFVAEYQPGLVSTEIHQTSVAGSEIDGVDADRLFSSATEAIAPERVAADLVECIRRPRLTMYSSPAARLGYALSFIDSVRLGLTTRLAAGVRRRTNLGVFTSC
jgi:short-subunit dehydrogenase